jgi:L-aminopeptidase/D-esterase-like protein
VERVAPRLKAAEGPSGAGTGASAASAGGGHGGASKEWRAHLDQTKSAEGTISTLLPDTRGTLDRMTSDLAALLETVASREKFINASYKHLSAEYGGSMERQVKMAPTSYT